MADGMDISAVLKLRGQVEDLPRAMTLALRAVAWRRSRIVRERAQQILRSKTNGTGKTADSIEVIEDEAHKQFLVHCAGDPERPANLPLWLERGTRFMTAKPFMRPAADESNEPYKREMLDAALKTVQEGLK